MEDLWRRLFTVVETMATRLTKDGEPKFHNSLVTNAQDVCDLLKQMNITKDPRLEALRKEVEARLCQTDSKELRKNETIRKQVGADAVEILKKFEQL